MANPPAPTTPSSQFPRLVFLPLPWYLMVTSAGMTFSLLKTEEPDVTPWRTWEGSFLLVACPRCCFILCLHDGLLLLTQSWKKSAVIYQMLLGLNVLNDVVLFPCVFVTIWFISTPSFKHWESQLFTLALLVLHMSAVEWRLKDIKLKKDLLS